MAESPDKPTTVSSQVMELRQLIAAPLLATVDADAAAARRYLECLCAVAFESYDPHTGRAGSVRMLRFECLDRETAAGRRRRIEVPLLSLVPLPLLHVQEADFDFRIDIVEAVAARGTEHFSLRKEHVVPDGATDEWRLRAALSPEETATARQSERQLTANMKVHVRMESAPMPGGTAKLLNWMTQAMAETSAPDEPSPSENRNH